LRALGGRTLEALGVIFLLLAGVAGGKALLARQPPKSKHLAASHWTMAQAGALPTGWLRRTI
jgi:hypothetical protein